MRCLLVFISLLVGVSYGYEFDSREDRIGSGSPASIYQFNYVVQLLRDSVGNGVFAQECAGTLLTTRHILTAAHCFTELFASPYRWQTRAGSPNRLSGGIIRNVAQIVNHPDFNSASHACDISVIVVNVPYVESTSIFRGQIAAQGSTLAADTVTTIVGWGTVSLGGARSDLLLQAEVPVWNILVCRVNYNQIGRWISDDMLCAGDTNVGICTGDNGGPLLFDNYVFGVGSWYTGCVNPIYPGIFTRVGGFTDWINSVTVATKSTLIV